MKQAILFDRNFLKKINILFLQIIVFLLPIHQKIIPPFIGLWIISSIVRIIVFKRKFTFNFSNVLLISFYLFLFFGVIWSQNKSSAWFDLEVKMSLFIFPFLLSFLIYSFDEIINVIKSLIGGVFTAFLILFSVSFINFYNTNDLDAFFYINLSPYIHPTYLSFYINLSIFGLLLGINQIKYRLFSLKSINVIFLVVLVFFNFLILSKIGVIVSVLILGRFLIKWVFTNKKYLFGMAIIILSFSLFLFSYKKSNYVNVRVNEFVEGLTTENSQKTYIEGSSSMRFEVWRLSVELIKEKPILGYGTGDVLDSLLKKYEKNGFEQGKLKRLNAHNQFLQVFISVGVFGFVLFLFLFLISLKSGMQYFNFYQAGFIIMSIFFMLPESILENQAGTIYFGLFFSLFSQKSLIKKSL